MLKRFFLALGILAGALLPAYSAGTISLSLSQQFDSLGKPLNGGKLYLYQAGTTTQQSAYQDSGLTIPHPNPITLDSAGRVPQFFLADGSIKIRLTNADGIDQLAADGILVVGASSGGGGGSPVDATTVFTTGDLKARYGTGTIAGFVRCNGRTIGSATSGATERANADTQPLFEYLWNADSNLAVSGGRGDTAAADWAANKTIALPDWRGRALAFLDDMGNSAAGRLTATYLGTAATVLGAAGGEQSKTLAIDEMPVHTHSVEGDTGTVSANHNHNVTVPTLTNVTAELGFSLAGLWAGTTTSTTGNISANHTHHFSVTSGSAGSGKAFPMLQPMKLATIYLKL